MNRQMMIKALFILNCFILASCGQSSGNAPSLSSDSGGGGGSSPTACNPCKMFVTSTTMQGDFAYFQGTISAADGHCASDSNNPRDGSTYKAFIMVGSNRNLTTNWVLHANTAYQRVDGTPIASSDSNSKLDITNLSNTITATSQYYWTGIKTGWIENTSSNCDTWTDGTSASAGSVGRGDGTGYSVVGGVSRSCDNLFGFLCVQQ